VTETEPDVVPGNETNEVLVDTVLELGDAQPAKTIASATHDTNPTKRRFTIGTPLFSCDASGQRPFLLLWRAS
jgi:hypothetical protein